MNRIGSFFVALGLASFAPALASAPHARELTAPASQKTSDGYGRWNELIHRALDGDASSATEIGSAYAYGTYELRDVPEAMRWLSRGIEPGPNEARRELGLLLLRGEGTPRDPGHAAELLLQAAYTDDWRLPTQTATALRLMMPKCCFGGTSSRRGR